MNLDQFITKYNGKSVANNHGGFVGECVSLAARKVQEVDNVPNGDAVLYCQATGGARDLYESPTNLLLTYYDRIPNGQPRVKGDLVVWGSTLGKYGDVAIALDSGTQLFGQLGTPVFIPANIRNETRQPLGYLRLKGTQVEHPTINTMRIVETEVNGSDYDFVHTGKFDKQLIAAYGNEDVNSYVYNSFTRPESATYRNTKRVWKDFYDKYSQTAPNMQKTIDDQAKQIKDLQAQLDAKGTQLKSGVYLV